MARSKPRKMKGRALEELRGLSWKGNEDYILNKLAIQGYYCKPHKRFLAAGAFCPECDPRPDPNASMKDPDYGF